MAVEWLVLWGAGKAVGTLAKPVLEDLAKDIAKDQGKSFFGKAIKRAAKLVPHDEYLKLYGKAIRELVDVIEEELKNAGIAADNVDVYAKDIKQFVRTESIREALPDAFATSTGTVEGHELKRGWEQLPDISPLPPEFDWDYVAKTFNRKLRKLREEDTDFRAVLQAQAAVEAAENTKQALGVQPDFQLRNYREALLERYANLHFDTLDTSGANYDGVKLWKVFVPQTVRESREYLPQLHEIPKEHLRRMVAKGELDAKDAEILAQELIEERRRTYLDQSPRSVLELTGDDRLMRIVILGDPGAGKSSLLQHLALEWARIEKPADREALPLPLLIELKEYDRWDCPNNKSFVRYLHDSQTWHRLDQVKLDERLRAAKQPTVLLLDGLDEVFDHTRRSQVINDIHYFSNQYPQVRIIATSRIIGYKPQRLADAEFSHFILQDLDEDQINDFLDRWHDTTFRNAKDAESKKARLARAIGDSPAIRELAGNPLLLTMMAILNREEELPRERIQLYERSARLLLHKWDAERTLDSHPQLKGHVGHKEKSEMLREIAFAMQSAPHGLAGNLISEAELERILCDYLGEKLRFQQPLKAARELIEQLRERNFILCFRGGDSYSFVHRTFLEYFCATAIHQRFVQKLDLDYLLNEIFAPHWYDEKWHEVLCLVAGQVAEKSVEQVAQIIEFLLSQQDTTFNFHHLFLAARCCQELRNPRTLGTAFDLARTALEKLLRFDFPYFYEEWEEEAQHRNRIRAKAVGTLAAALLPDNPSLWLKDRATKDDNWAVRQAAVQELARGWKDDTDTFWLKDQATNDNHWAVRQTAVQELAHGWKDDKGTLHWLKDRAVNDDFWSVRQTATKELARGWKDDPDTLLLLKDRAVTDEDYDVRQTAIQEFARGWKDDPNTLIWLKERVVNDDDEYGRYAALQELARGWKDNPYVLPLLKDLAVNDDDESVRTAAVQELARAWKNDADILPLLKDRAANDEDVTVQQAAVEELARGWKNDPDTATWLKDLATNDDNWSLRQTAMRELARGWKEYPYILSLLKDRAANDDDSDVRQVAVQELARGWKDDPNTLTWIKDHATNDEDESVRGASLHELVRGWRDDSDTLPLLKDRATNDEDESVQRAALQELARGWRDDPEIFPLLKERAVKDKYNDVRQAAVRELARGWKDDPEIFPLLKDRAENDENNEVRQAALVETALGWKGDTSTLLLLEERIGKDKNENIRHIAASLLSRGWNIGLQTLPWLKEHAVTDDNWIVRELALKTLAHKWKNDEETLHLLKDRAVNDSNEIVRRVVLEVMAQKWKKHPETLPLLKDRVVNDPHENVRQAVVRQMTWEWKKHPETLLLLKDRAINDLHHIVREEAVQQIGWNWTRQLDTLSLFKNRAMSDSHEAVRLVAAQLLALYWKKHPETLPMLKDRATKDDSPSAEAKEWEDGVRGTAIQLIARGWPDDPDTLAVLRERAENDPTPWLRKKAKQLADRLESRTGGGI